MNRAIKNCAYQNNKNNTHRNSIDLVRAVIALTVMGVHCAEMIYESSLKSFVAIAVLMDFFFMVSGFFMMSHIDGLKNEDETSISYVLHKIKGFFAPLCYVNETEPVIVAYPNVSEILVTLDNTGIWDAAALTEGETVKISLNTPGKYATLQDCFNLVYSNDRADYENDTEFCNFRAMKGGNLKEGFFWRGASPLDNKYGRASLTDRLIAEKGIRYELNLADAEDEMAAHLRERDHESPYAAELYRKGQAAAIGLNANYRSVEYRCAVADGLRQMMKAEGPVYIHCTEGKDRTGFVCVILEALAGASYDEMLNDYMITYSNYYSVDEISSPERYRAIAEMYFDDFIFCLRESGDAGEAGDLSYAECAASYLISGGMTEAETETLKDYLVGAIPHEKTGQ